MERAKTTTPPLLVIVGPTATGKTAVAVEVAKKIKGEIISADSMLIYRYMNIGTAKPAMEERQGIPHYMIDLIDPGEQYSVALFQQQAERHICEITAKDRLPLLVGGTGLYVRSVIDHYDFTRTGTDTALRQRLQNEAETRGVEAVYRQLKEVDPETAARLHPNNLKRVIRALEVYHQTGRPVSSFQTRDQQPRPKYNLLMFGLNMDRQALYNRIEERVDKMLSAGLLEEVQQLLDRGYGPELVSMQGLGYKEIIPYLKGMITLEEAILLLKRNTRRFAKRQMTWFKHDQRINWIDITRHQNIRDVAEEIVRFTAGVWKIVSKNS